MFRMMLAAPASGSGKTALTCGMLALLKRKGLNPAAFKSGPDYIDPMFHRSVLNVESHNLDLFLADEDHVRSLVKRCCKGHQAAVFEGVMGYYDGVGGITTQASAWHVADTLDLPVILVLRAKGSALTLAAQIKGMCSLRMPSHIKGVILNECSAMLFKSLAATLEAESGIPLLGYLPHMEEAAFESRHLGLYTAGEIDSLTERIGKIADMLEKSLDFDRLSRICQQQIPETEESGEDPEDAGTARDRKACDDINSRRTDAVPESFKDSAANVRIAVARDEAFCFFYEESLELFRDLGAEICFFSPLHDDQLPEDCQGLYLTGGYPELYTKELSDNEKMRRAVYRAVKDGMPTVAECGGFLYLGQSLQDSDGTIRPMAGVLDGSAICRQRLVRFGYSTLSPQKDSLLFRVGERIPVHEFHYWDSSDNGNSLHAVKPVSGRSWECGITSDTLYAGFPHLYFAGHPQLAERFLKAAAEYRK